MFSKKIKKLVRNPAMFFKHCVDVFIDKSCRSPLLVQGFHATLGELAIPNLLDQKVAMHLFYPNENS